MRERKKIVFTGQSGVHPEIALKNFVEKSGLFLEGNKPDILSVEDTIINLLPDKDFYAFLRLPIPEIRNKWKKAFRLILDAAKKYHTNDIFVVLHACYYTHRTEEFISCVAEDLLKELDPDFFITFIDDIYDIHSALREDGKIFSPLMGGATLDNPFKAISELYRILSWRAFEVTMARHLAYSLGDKLHYIFAVKHDYNTLHKLIYYPDIPKFYISHPIHEVKRLEDKKEYGRANEIKQQIELFEEGMSSRFICFRPTTIDELRIMEQKKDFYVPKLRKRWAEEKYKKPEGLLYFSPSEKNVPPWDSPVKEKTKKTLSPLLRNLIRVINAQISSRDLKLVEQSNHVAAWRPCFNGNASRGVVEEIKYLKDLRDFEQKDRHFFVYSPSEDWESFRKTCNKKTIKNAIAKEEIISSNLPNEQIEKCSGETIEQIMDEYSLQVRTEDRPLGGDAASQAVMGLNHLKKEVERELNACSAILERDAKLFWKENSLAPSSFVDEISKCPTR